MTSNTKCLTAAVYSGEKRRITLEFSSLGEKISKSFPFFPSFFIEKSIQFKELNNLLCNYNPQKFKLVDRNTSFEVQASTFHDLKCLANICLDSFGSRPVVIEPERQFLIKQQWNYFDSFSFFEGMPVKSGKTSFPSINWGLLDEPLFDSSAELLSHDKELGKDLMGTFALSKILKLPPESIPGDKFRQVETFVENMFFKNCFSVRNETVPLPYHQNERQLFTGNFIEMDFSKLWPMLLTRPFQNLGPDSIDCICCVPKTLSDSNVLPSSTVKARILSEGFYFESILPGYAKQFHNTRPLRENREKLRKEFFLNYLPVGPFARNHLEEIPLCDALVQSSKGKMEIEYAGKLNWFCKKKESFLSKELALLNKGIVRHSNKLLEMEKNAMQYHGLMASGRLSQDPEFVFKSELKNALHEIYVAIPLHITSPKSRFFSKNLANAINAVQVSTINRFGQLVAERNGRIMCNGIEKAFIRAENPMSLAKEFSKREKIPLLVSRAK